MFPVKLAAKFRNTHVQIASAGDQLVVDGKALFRHPRLPDRLHQSTEVVEQRQVGQLAQEVCHLIVALGEVQVSAHVSFDCHCNVAACQK